MNKPVLTWLLAFGCTSGALGQGLELYGILDGSVGYARQQGSRSDVSIDSGVSNDSRIGLRGSEALRGGLKARFRLESGIEIDQGVRAEENLFFDRAAWVGLEGALGEVRLGRQPVFGYDWFKDASPFGTDYKQASLETVFGYDEVGPRVDNAIFYLSPSFGGFKAGAGYSFNDDGPETPGEDNEVVTLGLRYSGGPVSATAAYEIRRDADDDATPDRADIRNLSLGATVEISRVKLHAAFGRLKHRSFSRDALPEKSWLVGATLPLGRGELLAGYQRAVNRNLNELDVDGARHGYALAYEHSLSSRTVLYVYGSRFRRVDLRADDEGRLADRVELGSGVRFTF